MEEYFDSADVEKNRLMALLSYLGILVIVPIIVTPDSKFVRYHANQGLILLIADIVLGAVGKALALLIGWIPLVGGMIVGIYSAVIGLAIAIFVILGIVNAVQGKGKPLPIIGGFTLLK